MLHLIPAPWHRLALRMAYRLRGRVRRVIRWPSRGAVVIASDEAGRVLLVRHCYGSGRWALPGGGMNLGEDPAACARREMREELACELAMIELIEVVEGSIQGSPNRSWVYAARFAGEPIPDGREILELGWFGLDALPEDMVSASRRQLERGTGR